MLPYTNRGRSQDPKVDYELGRSCTYDLLSVVVHVGEIDTGHYISYCRVGEQVGSRSDVQKIDQSNDSAGQWFAFNDHRVELASKSDVLGARAYLLFYIIRSLA
jgi:ubiquitin carboxyl-terminal hydrolase 22/27/51